ncbi:MAG: TIGR04141 family sporadically distributed protein [Acidobacteriaceae bacterium]
MSRRHSKVDLNIYLAKSDVRDANDVLKKSESLKAFELDVMDIKPCTLYIKSSHSNPPRWANFFASVVDRKEFGQNASTGAVLFAKVGKAVLVLTFGQGHHLIDSAKLEMNFGLRAALNLINVESLRSIDKSSFEQHPTQTRHQTGVAAEIQSFGLDIERDLLRAITGEPTDETYGKRISGMDALKLSVETNLDSLKHLLQQVVAAHNDESYKKGPFAWVDHIGEVKDKPTHGVLDTLLIERLHSGQYQNIWLTVPEIVDWNRIVGFRYSESAKAPSVYDIRVPDFLESFRGSPPDIQQLKQRRIYCVDSDDCVVLERPAYRFIYAELEYQSDIYVLNNGKWYKVSRSFADQINEYFEKVPKYSKSFPVFNDNTEGEYNARVASSDPKSFVLLDKQNIKVAAAASPVEPCDLLRDGNEFIHVKRYGGSSVLSHLFNQGLVAGELFQMELDFRKQLNDKLPEIFRMANPVQRPGTNAYQVVFAVISESDEGDLSIPFFSKISLRHVISRLEAIGFRVVVAKISVQEIKKKTKKYAPTNKGI